MGTLFFWQFFVGFKIVAMLSALCLEPVLLVAEKRLTLLANIFKIQSILIGEVCDVVLKKKTVHVSATV